MYCCSFNRWIVKVVLDYRQHNENLPGADLGGEVLEFIQAMAAFQKATGRRYPTWSEVLEVAKSLGYRRSDPPQVGIEP